MVDPQAGILGADGAVVAKKIRLTGRAYSVLPAGL